MGHLPIPEKSVKEHDEHVNPGIFDEGQANGLSVQRVASSIARRERLTNCPEAALTVWILEKSSRERGENEQNM